RGPRRRLILPFQPQVRLLIVGGQPAPAPLDRPGDPAETGVEDGPAPCPRLLDLLGRGTPEQAHPVVALTPCAVRDDTAACGPLQESPRLGKELLQVRIPTR